MKKHFLALLVAFSLFQIGYAQAPSAIPYQAVVRNTNGNTLPNHSVQVRFTIHDSISTGNVVYQETHSLSTNAQGLVITNIGQGTSTNGTFSAINWGKNNKFVQTELSINNDDTFTDLGTTQFLSVPYALHANCSDYAKNGMPNGSSPGEMLFWDGTIWVKVAPGGYGQPLVMCDGVPTWGCCLPKLQTTIISVSAETASVNGDVLSAGGGNISITGFCWSTNHNPTIDSSYKTEYGWHPFSEVLSGLTPNTTYYVRAYATNSAGTAYGNEVSFTTLQLLPPLINTTNVDAISSFSAVCGGDISSDGNSFITDRGICWSTSNNPTIDLATKTNEGTGTSSFSSSMTNLSPNTIYFVRAYATNITGTVYGNEISFTTQPIVPIFFGNGFADIDGNTYDTISICNKVWMKQNLNVSRYRNGDIIPQVTDPTQWASLTTGAWCYYNNDNSKGSVYGKLYNWYAVNDPRGLAPEGWHVPSDMEWNILTSCLGISAGAKMKSEQGWLNGGNGINSTGFSGIPGGRRLLNGTFNNIGSYANWWCTTQENSTLARNWYLAYNINSVGSFNHYKTSGFSIRCLKDIVVVTPTISTDTILSITSISASCKGNISNDGGGTITAGGVCWSTSTNPTIELTTKTTDGTNTGSFTSSITGLNPNTTYYVRAYATNSAGTSYGSEMSFTTQPENYNTDFGVADIDGNTYDTVRICNQAWTKKNLNVSRYRNGDIIPQVTDPTEWANLTTGAWCYYNNDSTNGDLYGKLYNWYAVNDPRGLTPEGWHVPSNGEWNNMTKFIDQSVDTTAIFWSGNFAGTALKDTAIWSFDGIRANSSGFNGLPGGSRSYNGNFNNIGSNGNCYWWSFSQNNNTDAWSYYLYNQNEGVGKIYNHKAHGFSVRCVKDELPSTLNDGLVAYYPFNGNANDESGNGNNGTIIGATLTNDRLGNIERAYSFDGYSTINVEHSNSLLVNNEMTICVWFIPGVMGNTINYMLQKGDGGGCENTGYYCAVDYGFGTVPNGVKGLGYGQYNSCAGVGSDTPLVYGWHMMTMVYQPGGENKIYFDGKLTNGNFSYCPTCLINNSFTPLIIGGFYGAGNISNPKNWNGKLDDIRIYNRALTQEEISYLAGH